MSKVILFDGVCNFCDQSVQFILKRDKQEQFTFASLQGDAGQELLKRNYVPTNMNSFILIDGNKTYFKSTAALRVCKRIKRRMEAFIRLHDHS